MRTNHVEASLAKGFCADAEGIDRGIILREEELSAGLHLAQLVASIKVLKACLFELLTYGLDSQKVDWRIVEELQKGTYTIHKLYDYIFNRELHELHELATPLRGNNNSWML